MAGMTTEQYLESTKKTRESMREEMRETGKKRAYMQLLINKIASDNDIHADKEKVEHELGHAMEMYKDNKDFDEDRARAYFESIFLNQAVLEYLESLK